jgi:hypothetical protein
MPQEVREGGICSETGVARLVFEFLGHRRLGSPGCSSGFYTVSTVRRGTAASLIPIVESRAR